MHLNALLDNHGKVTFSKPLFLKQKQVKVEIIIPNDVIAPIMVSVIRQQLDKILGKYSHQRSAVSPYQDKMAWHQHLVQKYL
jgi:hypothetical protein